MRRIFSAAKAAGILILCAAYVFAFALFVHCPVFGSGSGYELYVSDSSSSPIVRTEDPLREKLSLNRIAGESVRYDGNRYEALKEQFSAVLLFTEEACGVTNYYLYSPLLGTPLDLKGHPVNLHIAVTEESTAAGTPLIFGGF